MLVYPRFFEHDSQGESIDELIINLKEVIELLLEDGEPELDVEFDKVSKYCYSGLMSKYPVLKPNQVISISGKIRIC